MTTAPRSSRTTRAARTAVLLAAAVLAGATAAVPAQADPAGGTPPWARTARISTGVGGAQPDGETSPTGLSADGRWAVLGSGAANLVPGDTNEVTDVFVRDLLTGRTERVSLTASGGQADDSSSEGAINATGRYVVFTSAAALVPGDTNGAEDIYLRDRWTGRTERITVGDPVREEPDRGSYTPTISADGRYVAFASTRTDLVPGDTPPRDNVYVTDRWTGTTRLITVGADGTPANRPSFWPVISADGGSVGFISRATNLLPPEEGGEPAAEPGSEPGPTDAPGSGVTKPRLYPFYVHDLATGRTSAGSTDETGALRGVNSGNLSPDGRLAVYSLLVPDEPDGSGWRTHLEILVRDLRTNTVRRVPTALPGTRTTGHSYDPVVAPGNRWVYFTSSADNLVEGDTNGVEDVFRHDLWTGRTERVSVSSDGTQSTGASYTAVVGGLGTTVLFSSEDGTLVPGDTNGRTDAFSRHVLPF
ncbi:hypothetical protein [Kitasatospora purpeofusca]|uniref:hypothetical protein n=1 Tax=Kitasatospora purpeofusca TaxID=67352 RepID=UPI0036D32383